MIIGIPKETKSGELRVGLVPSAAKQLVDAGHEVRIEQDAGNGAGFTNKEYEAVGVKVVSIEQAWDVDLVCKVKEPQTLEHKFFKPGVAFWGALHLAASKETTIRMVEARSTAFDATTLFVPGEGLKILKPMSAIAGRRAVVIGAWFSEKQNGGQGILVQGLEGSVEGGTYLILGGGNAGQNATNVALGLGAKVKVLELNEDGIKHLEQKYAGQDVQVIKSTEENLREHIKTADVLISTILIPGTKPPKIVKEDMVKTMKPGSVIIDISIDQGGSVETIDHYTTHADPVFEKHGVIHYAVGNMPAAVPQTASKAWSAAGIDYILEIANKGIDQAIKNNEIRAALNIYNGDITYEGLAVSHDLEYKPLTE